LEGFELDELIIVDENDNMLSFEKKDRCHEGDGILHRAFSIFILNSKKQILMQQRSRFKKLWPLHWSNTCCSHQRPNEYFLASAERRLVEETGIFSRLRYVYKFRYSARYKDVGSENEVCSVFIGTSNDEVTPNPEEIADYKWMNIDELVDDVKKNPEKYTPWFRMEIKQLLLNYWSEIDNILLEKEILLA
jgi:isopentenyl-diphosphate Delta-isomerase